jgi:hypothetical protein
MEHAFLYNRVKEAGLISADAVIVAMSKMLDEHKPVNKRVFDTNGEGGEDDSPQPAKKKRRLG